MKVEEWHDGCQIIVSLSELKDWLGKSGALHEFELSKETAKTKGLKVRRVLFPKIPQNFFGVPVVEKST